VKDGLRRIDEEDVVHESAECFLVRDKVAKGRLIKAKNEKEFQLT
jgi:hypothetical protein